MAKEYSKKKKELIRRVHEYGKTHKRVVDRHGKQVPPWRDSAYREREEGT